MNTNLCARKRGQLVRTRGEMHPSGAQNYNLKSKSDKINNCGSLHRVACVWGEQKKEKKNSVSRGLLGKGRGKMTLQNRRNSKASHLHHFKTGTFGPPSSSAGCQFAPGGAQTAHSVRRTFPHSTGCPSRIYR